MGNTRLVVVVLGWIATVASIICATRGAQYDGDRSEKVMKDLLENYDKHIRPSFRGKAINVTMTAYILDLYNIDEQNHEFTVNMYLRHSWQDSRLSFDPTNGVSELMLDTEQAIKIWAPDTFILNERKSKVHDLTLRNEFTKVSSGGVVSRSTRFTVTASCKMSLGWFPFDRHTCTLEIESYGHTAADFLLLWKRDYEGSIQTAVSISEEASSLTFKVRGIHTKEISSTFSNKTYCRLSMEFFLVRASTRFLQDFYFPAIILTIIAFFTLHFGGTHEFRIQLSSLCMITLIIFMSVSTSAMPKVSYQTALDFYLFNSVVMIFNVVLVHFGLYHFMKIQRAQGLPMRYVQEGPSNAEAKENLCDGDTQSDFISIGRPAVSSKLKNILFHSCKKSKTMLPIIFIVFNIIYWIVVLIGSFGYPDDFLILEAHN